MIGKYNISVILTYIGVCISITGMALVFRGDISTAMICFIFAGICDLFDGVIARKCKRTEEEKQFGVQIDSMADMISFVAFPVVIGLNTAGETLWLTVSVMMLYSLCGIIRLAWFNMTTNSEGNRKYYDGLPVTYSALIFPLLWLLQGVVAEILFSIIWIAAYIVTALLFVLNIKIRKPTGIWYIVFGVLAIAVTTAIIFKKVL